ncbi:MAG: polyamine aminopropyltransferase [Armatimonadetes bacterium]|nr:polyamine aminopropyltransferase [Armatimonadota bacterium]
MPVESGQVLTYPIRSHLYSMSVEVKEVLHRHQSDFQLIEIIDTECFGRMLLLDGHIQLAELDESAYHESLVHIPLLNMASPKRALIVGGGDGGVVRELLKHPGLEIDMVEIDMGVIDASRAQLPFLNQGCFEDPRLTLYVEDAFPFVKQPGRGPYDLIVMDSTDTYEEEDGEISEMLFTREFFTDCAKLLTPGGMVVTQADNHIFCPYSLENAKAEYLTVFERVDQYFSLVPSFGGFSGYCIATNSGTLSRTWNADRAKGLNLRYLNETTYSLAFQNLPFNLNAAR